MAYRYMYEVEIKHKGLNKYRVVKGSDKYVVEQKANTQLKQWDEMWLKKQEAEQLRNQRENIVREKEAKKELAIEHTKEAEDKIHSIENTLLYTLNIDDKIDWESLKDLSTFEKPKPSSPSLLHIPEEPRNSLKKYQPNLNIWEKMIPPIKNRKMNKCEDLYQQDYRMWEKEKEDTLKKNDEAKVNFDNQLKQWEEEEKEFLANQNAKNIAIENQKENYLKALPTAVIDYCDMVLSTSFYPDEFPQEFDIDYNPDNKILVVDYSLPSPDRMPTLKEVKYIQSKDEFKNTYLSAAAENKLYDNLLYQITLRSLHELFEADTVDAIESIVFNGWVKSIDRAKGKEVNACILTVQTTKKEFSEINLALVDPKLCFKNLKGIGSSKLHSLSPIAPIIKIDREDPRFVSSYAVANSIDENVNLAAMDWQDFEHLIRELFEKEFNQSGGEVKITRASKDGGVDAIAFDPDPLRGGKVIIQAKRYMELY
jgi:restriction system protein